MCGRFRLTRSQKAIAQQFDAELLAALNDFEDLPRINIAPTQQVVAVKQGKGRFRIVTRMRWGLIPVWAKDASIGNRNINARSDRIREIASFRDLISSRRCLIPADGFYEWQKSGKIKQPYCFEVVEGEGLFAFAGLWDSWKDPHGEIVESCTILTTTPNELVARLHDRMPVIVPREKYEKWLDPDIEDYEAIRDIFDPYDATKMREYPANPKLNNAKNEDMSLAGPVEAIEPEQGGLF
jgi:putative SOS response-associated peptidase YedK